MYQATKAALVGSPHQLKPYPTYMPPEARVMPAHNPISAAPRAL